MVYDKIIFGAGFYGLYAAKKCGEAGQKVLVIEKESNAFMRASSINQARVHMGYHYPRSIETAVNCAKYFERFCQDFDFCLHKSFEQVYATGKDFSRTNAQEYKHFLNKVGIKCDEISPAAYFKEHMCDGAFLTQEYTYDARVLKRRLLEDLSKLSNVEIIYNHYPERITQLYEEWVVKAGDLTATAPYILNATYAGVNDIHAILGLPLFHIKYEKCEVILCEVSENLKNTGLTVMDGPFFSLMPFGQTGLHSLTSVTFTPHDTCYEGLAEFDCQKNSNGLCSKGNLYNCNECPAKPESAWPYMSQLVRNYLQDKYEFRYRSSLFSMKPILQASEIDDSRPTVVEVLNENPYFVSVLSGKINTVYELDKVLFND